MKQVYVITTERRGHTNTYTGTLDYLVDRCFGYTIECNGYSRNCKSLNTLLGRLNGGTSYWSIPQKSWIDDIVRLADHHGIKVFMKGSLRGIMGEDFRRDKLAWEEHNVRH